MPTIKLQSSDSEVFPVDVEVILTWNLHFKFCFEIYTLKQRYRNLQAIQPLQVAKQSVTIKTMLEDLGMDDDVGDLVTLLMGVVMNS